VALQLTEIGARGHPRRLRAQHCEPCGHDWPSHARFCGRCGRCLNAGRSQGQRAADADGGESADGTTRARRLLLLLALAATVVGAVLAAGQLGDPVAEAPVPTQVTGAVQVEPPPDPTEAVLGFQETCERSTRDRGGCGPRLLDDRPTRGALSTLPPATAFLADRGELHRFDLPDDVPTWTTVPFHGPDDVRVRAHEDGLVVTRAGGVALLDSDTGMIRWREELPGGSARIPPRAWLIAGDVFVLDTARRLSAFAGATGELLWTIDQVSPEAVPTVDGILVSRDGTLGLWQAGSTEPTWTRPETVPIPHNLLGDRPAASPVRMLVGRSLLVPQTGEILDVRDGAPTTVRVHGDVTMVLRWPALDVLELSALGPGGEVLWERDDLPVACCVARTLEASDGRIAIGPTQGPHVVLDRTDGTLLWELHRPSAWLEGLAGDLAIWREDAGLVGTDLRSGREAFRGDGTIRSLEPLLIAGPGGLVHITPGGVAPLQPRRVLTPAHRR